MASRKRFGSSSHAENTFDRFERPILRLMRDGAKKALDDAGIKYRVDRQGEIYITKQHLDDEKWEHHFSIQISAQYGL